MKIQLSTPLKLPLTFQSNTQDYINGINQTDKKKIGQFITPTNIADFMSQRLINNISSNKKEINILDPGAGTGLLGITLANNLFTINENISIDLTCCEIDKDVNDVLKKNLQDFKINADKAGLSFNYKIITSNYILTSIPPRSFDLVIANPPYKKLRKDSFEASIMSHVVYGAPNLYGLFWAKSADELKDNGLSCFIMPRSWMSGLYFEKLRQFMLKFGSIVEIHTFKDRNNIFGNAKVLQELVIVVFAKKAIQKIHYYTHENITELNTNRQITVPKQLVIVGKKQRILILSNKQSLQTLKWANKLDSFFKDDDLKMKTGITVAFRNKKDISNIAKDGFVPLFYSANIVDHNITQEIKENRFVRKTNKALLQKNQEYIFVKRFSSKEEKRRLHTGYYDPQQFPTLNFISTDNKINFVQSDNKALLRGAFIVLSSTQFDNYYRLLSGNTQVNSSEINDMKFPNASTLCTIGSLYSPQQLISLSQKQIDTIVADYTA